MKDLPLKKPVAIVCALSLLFAGFIFVIDFRLSYSRLAAQYTRMAEVGAEKISLSLEKTQVIVQSIAWSKQLRSQDMEGTALNIKRMHGLYPTLHTIYVSDRYGKVLLATADKVIPNEIIYVNDRSYFQAAQGGKTAITGPLIPRGQRNTHLAIIVSTPYYLDNGNFGGVVAAAVNLESLTQLLADKKEDKNRIVTLISPTNGPILTFGGDIGLPMQMLIRQKIITSNTRVRQVAEYSRTFSLAPLSTATPLWVAVMARDGVVTNLVFKNILIAMLAAMLMAFAFGNVLMWNRRQRERELERKKQMAFIGEMAATIAHEIRNPLTYIKGRILMQSALGDKDNELMLEEVGRIETVINDILLSAKPLPLQAEEVILIDLVSDAIRIMMGIASEKGIIIQLITTDYDIIIKADRVQLRHVFINLVKNAIDAMHKPGMITVTVKSTSQAAIITVEDEGEGMTDQEMKHLGKVFYTTKKGGTGLGISTCNRIVKAHQGKMVFTSTKGLGTTVEVSLPYLGRPEI